MDDSDGLSPSRTRAQLESTLALVVSMAALGWAVAALWPGGQLPAWPAVSLGVLALYGSWGRGVALQRGIASIAGTVAAALGILQIVVLWGAAEGLSRVLS